MNWLSATVLIIVLYFAWKIVRAVRSIFLRVIGLAAAALSLWRLLTLFGI